MSPKHSTPHSAILTSPATALPLAPIIRWAGSKRKSVDKLKRYWNPQFTRYIEPFAGSACLYFSLPPVAAVLADVNDELINFYECLRLDPLVLRAEIKSIPVSEARFKRMRAINPGNLTSLQRAARFCYLNRHCFNGLYRTNRAGMFNVPYSNSRNGDIPGAEHFCQAAKRLSDAVLACSDFEEVIFNHVRAGDFVYIDPPYAVAHRRVFSEYGPGTFNTDDLWRLRESLLEIERRGAHFLLTYAICPVAQKLFKTWHAERIMTQRNIAGFHEKRKKSTEVLYSNITIRRH